MARLQILKGDQSGKTFELGDTNIIGRHYDCDIVLGLNTVSKRHAKVVRTEDGWAVEDMGSRNGTFVNGERVERRRAIAPSDRIKVCEVLFTFELEPPAPAEEAKPAVDVAPAEEAEDSQPTIMSTLDVTAAAGIATSVKPEVKLKAVSEISQALGSTLEVDKLLPKVLDSIFEMFPQADRGFVLMCEGESERLMPKAVKHRRDEDEESVTYSRTIVRQALDQKCAILSADASSDSRFSMSQSIADFRIRSMMCVPLITQSGEPLGIINVDTQDQRARFTQEDLDLLSTIGTQAAIAMENATLHERLIRQAKLERDVSFARQVQRSFLPAAPPDVPGYEFFAHYESAFSVGGDYYDFLELPEQRLAVALGDVSGKGVAAALMMARLSSDVRSCTISEPDAAQVVADLNAAMNRLAESGLEDRFVTFVLVALDLASHEAVIVNAGHMAPMLYQAAAGEVTYVGEEEAGLPLGVADDMDYEAVTVKFEPGDALVIFTDGVSEAMAPNGDLYGLERLAKLVKSTPATALALGKTILNDVRQHADGQAQNDDICLVCMGRTE